MELLAKEAKKTSANTKPPKSAPVPGNTGAAPSAPPAKSTTALAALKSKLLAFQGSPAKPDGGSKGAAEKPKSKPKAKPANTPAAPPAEEDDDNEVDESEDDAAESQYEEGELDE